MNPGPADRQARWLATAQERGPRARLLWPLSLLYRMLTGLRRRLYVIGVFKTRRLPVAVVVVGNVVVGGAGKTPTVIALVQQLRALGWQPGVISRGYGRRSEKVTEVGPDTPAADSGDEPALIRRATGVPVFVARRRIDAAQALLAAHPQVNVLLCDDGLQHLALARDLSIAVFDERGTGNGWLLPAGLLREPWPPAPGTPFSPDLVLIQHRQDRAAPVVPSAAGVPVFHAVRRLADHAVGVGGERIALEALQGKALTAVAGIARPAVFFDMLRARGLTLAREVALPDHADQAVYEALLASPTTTVVCTEKDSVKLFALHPDGGAAGSVDAWAVPLELVPEAAFFTAVGERLAALKNRR